MDIIDKIYSEPEKWRTSDHYFKHECGVSIWIANGFTHCKPNGAYSLLSKYRLWRAYKWWCKNAPMEKLK